MSDFRVDSDPLFQITSRNKSSPVSLLFLTHKATDIAILLYSLRNFDLS